jgi:hypothetical protein
MADALPLAPPLADADTIENTLVTLYALISGPAGQPRDWDRFRQLFILHSMGFEERQIAMRVERFGCVAHAWSTYESRHAPDEEPFARGINSIQLYNDGTRWWVVTVFWDSERVDNPIPATYLPG